MVHRIITCAFSSKLIVVADPRPCIAWLASLFVRSAPSHCCSFLRPALLGSESSNQRFMEWLFVVGGGGTDESCRRHGCRRFGRGTRVNGSGKKRGREPYNGMETKK
jgi:hypothetical protein